MDLPPSKVSKKLSGLPASAWGETALVFLVGVLWFGALAPSYPVPGPYTDALVGAALGDVFVPVSHPLWSVGMAVLADLTHNPFGAVANRFSAVTTALVVALLFLLVMRLPYDVGHRITMDESRARRVGGWVAAGFAWVGVPFLDVAMTGNPEPLAMLWLLVSAHGFVTFYRHQRRSGLWLGWWMLGLASMELASMLWLVPVFAVWSLLTLHDFGRLKPGWILGSVGLYGAGALVYVVRGMMLAHQQAALGAEIVLDGQLVRAMWGLHHAQAMAVMDRPEVLLLLLFTVIPLILVYRRTASAATLASNRWNWQFLFPALIVVAVIQVMNLPGSPWSILPRFSGLAWPYLLTCLWAGRLIGFQFHPVAQMPQPVPKTPAQRIVTKLALPFLAVLLVHSGWKNQAVEEREELAMLGEYLMDVVAIPRVEWIVADGMSDGLIVLGSGRGSERGPRVINLTATLHPAYIRHLFQREGIPLPEDHGSEHLNRAFLQWMASLDQAAERVVVVQWPEFLRDLRRSAFPLGPVYRGISSSEEAAQWAKDLKVSLAYYERWAERVAARRERSMFRLRHSRWLHDHLSKAANNLGALFHRLRQSDEAERAWLAALRLSPGNVVARWNHDQVVGLAGERDDLWPADLPERHALQLRWGDFVEVK